MEATANQGLKIPYAFESTTDMIIRDTQSSRKLISVGRWEYFLILSIKDM
jgi:hypothetical protein